MSRFEEVVIKDDNGTLARVEPNGGLAVNVQDQVTEVVDLFMFNEEGTFTLASGVSIDDTTFTATGGHGISIGDVITIEDGARHYQSLILNVVTNTITVDSPFDFAYTTDAIGIRGIHNMNVNGSVTPVIFRVTPKNLTNGIKWDIVRVIFTIEDDTSMDTSKFGGISALTNGFVLRLKNGTTKNIFNVKSNGDFANRAYDISYDDRAPAGLFGLRVRRTFGGAAKTGVTLRMEATTDDALQIIVADDLTALTTFTCVVQGHVVID